MKLILNYPVRPIGINQGFGQNPQIYSQPLYGGIKGHNGIDFMAKHGQPIYAAHDGMAYYEYDGNQGEGVVLRTNQPYDYNGEQVYFKTIYWHMCDPVKEPQFTSPVYKAVGYKPDQTGVSQVGVAVKQGDLIGYADTTGASTGDHLHFGLKTQAQNESNGAFYNLNQNNGYNGAIDPMPYLVDLDAAEAEVEMAASAIKIIQEAPVPVAQKLTWLAQITAFLKNIFK